MAASPQLGGRRREEETPAGLSFFLPLANSSGWATGVPRGRPKPAGEDEDGGATAGPFAGARARPWLNAPPSSGPVGGALFARAPENRRPGISVHTPAMEAGGGGGGAARS